METLKTYLSKIEDVRINRHKRYPLEEILFLTTVACIAGCYTFNEISDFGKARLAFLRKYYPYKNGIASHDTINRVLGLIDPIAFNIVFMDWIRDVLGEKEPDVVSIDGKALKGTAPKIKNSKELIHQISAWANESEVVLGQTTVEGKGREIEGIKALLDILDIEGDTVTIDAIGCQTAIIEQITEKKGNYVIAVKGNQKELHEEIVNAFSKITIKDKDVQTDGTGGRVVTRTCSVIHNLETFIPAAERFSQAKTVIRIESQRYDKRTKKTVVEERFYISNLEANAKYFNKVARQHWAVENNLHWHLDVSLNEDKDRKRTDNLSSNFALVRKIALNFLTKIKKKENVSMPRMQKRILMDTEYLSSFLF